MRAHFSIIVICFLFSSCFAATNTEQPSPLPSYLKSNNLDSFLSYCGSEEQAISELMKYSLADTINEKDIWYNQLMIDSLWMYSSTEGVALYYTSLKLKSFYWIVRIFNSDLKGENDSLCKFINSDGGAIFDYITIDRTAQIEYYKRVLSGKSKTVPPDFKYVKYQSESYSSLEQQFNDWWEEMKDKGLNYMRTNGKSPIGNKQYKLDKDIRLDFRKMRKNNEGANF